MKPLAIFLLFCLAPLEFQQAHAQRTITDSPKIAVPHPDKANPEKDCMRAIGKNDLRFIGVAGYALIVPGVADYHSRYWKTNGVKVIAGTSDVGNRPFNDAASKYALRYNKQLLNYLATHNTSHPKT